MQEITLSDAEREAKNYVINLMLKGINEDSSRSSSENDLQLPDWYDAAKFKRGQKYFAENRAAIVVAIFYGVFAIISDPMTANVLDRTGMSSKSSTARKRYANTTLHMITWYESDLRAGSESWESLKLIRKMHSNAAKNAQKHEIGTISPFDMTITMFGFIGYVLTRPYILGIWHDNDDDRDGFVHFWAVINHMLGIPDEFNICLHSLEVVIIICRTLIRHIFIPFLQLETPTFTKLGKAYVEGMSLFVFTASYESRLFLAKRLTGVPGYQFDVDMSTEVFQRLIFSPDEIKMLNEHFQTVPAHDFRRHMMFSENIYLLDVKRNRSPGSSKEDSSFHVSKEKKSFLKLLELKNLNDLEMTKVDDKNIQMHLNEHKFYELSKKEQRLVKIEVFHAKVYATRFGRLFYELFIAFIIFLLKMYRKFN